MFLNPEKQVFCRNEVYFYRKREGSLMNTKGESRCQRHMKSMIAAIDLWSEFLEMHKGFLTEEKKDNIRKRQYQLSAAACLDALRSTQTNAYEVRDILRSKGVYPYPYMQEFLSPPRNIANFLKFFLRNSFVYTFFAKTDLIAGK